MASTRMLPGMKFATLAQCPVFGGKVAHVDDSAAKAVPGVRQIVVLDDLVAVVGDHTWAAKKGLDALEHDLGRRAEREGQFGRYLARLARREQKGRRRCEIGRRHRQGFDARRPGRRRIRAAVPGARAHGAGELHGACHGGCLRSMDRHPGHDALPVLRGTSGGSAARQGDRAQPSARRRFRPPARSRHGRELRCASPKRSTVR